MERLERPRESSALPGRGNDDAVGVVVVCWTSMKHLMISELVSLISSRAGVHGPSESRRWTAGDHTAISMSVSKLFKLGSLKRALREFAKSFEPPPSPGRAIISRVEKLSSAIGDRTMDSRWPMAGDIVHEETVLNRS